MKKQIEYFYNLIIDEIRLTQDEYSFTYENNNYLFASIEENQNPTELYQLNKMLLAINPNVHEILLNRNQNITTRIHDKNYILFKINTKANKRITLEDILNLATPTGGQLLAIPWKQLWSRKVDNFEYYIDYIQEKNTKLREYYDYFIGMSELAMEYLNFQEKNAKYYPVISHRRIKQKETLLDYYNPMTIIIDDISRDIAEYLKMSFFSKKEIIDFTFLDKLNKNNMILLISRMLFPTFFYDLFEKKSEQKEEQLGQMISQMPEYEKFLKKIIDEIKKRTEVPEIPWL